MGGEVMSVEYEIVCDNCGAVVSGSNISAAVARRSLREDGGRVNLPGGKDLCANCVKDGRRPE